MQYVLTQKDYDQLEGFFAKALAPSSNYNVDVPLTLRFVFHDAMTNLDGCLENVVENNGLVGNFNGLLKDAMKAVGGRITLPDLVVVLGRVALSYKAKWENPSS